MTLFLIITLAVEIALIAGYPLKHRNSGSERWDILGRWLLLIFASLVFDVAALVTWVTFQTFERLH